MQSKIHPNYAPVAFTCACGNQFETQSTLGKESQLIDICSECHPFYTGKQKIVDTAGRVDRFRQRYGGGAAQTADKGESKAG